MKKIIIDKVTCIGCGLCVSLADKVFKMNFDEMKAEVYGNCGDFVDCETKVTEAIESCPLRSISIEEEEEKKVNE